MGVQSTGLLTSETGFCVVSFSKLQHFHLGSRKILWFGFNVDTKPPKNDVLSLTFDFFFKYLTKTFLTLTKSFDLNSTMKKLKDVERILNSKKIKILRY